MQEIVHTNPFYAVSREDYQLPNGHSGVYYGIRGLRTAMIVPLLDERTLVLTYQWRYLLNERVWEFPAGRVEPNEKPSLAAARELEEEVGYLAGQLDYVGWYSPCNGLSDEHTFVFIARHLRQTKQRLEAVEDLTAQVLPIDQFEQMIKTDQIHDGMSLAAWQLTKKYL